MTTKQMAISFQVENTSETPNNVEITLGGTTVYTGTLPETGPISQIVGSPVTSITFDIDVPDASKDNLTSTMAFSATINGANVQIQNISTNYNYTRINVGTPEAPYVDRIAGTNTAFIGTNIISQPQWNGITVLGRYNIEYHIGPTNNSGPGAVLIYNNETATFNLAVDNFNNTVPIPGATG
jgi:hypothetical protein